VADFLRDTEAHIGVQTPRSVAIGAGGDGRQKRKSR
jgi:hypothetical protein